MAMGGLAQMKKYLLAGVVIGAVTVAMTGSVVAADMPVMPAPIPMPVFSWTGFYVGLHGGWGFSDVGFHKISADIGDHTMDGGLAGGHIGYNWQMGYSWLVGLEASGTWSGVKKTIFGPLHDPVRFPGAADDRWTTEVKWLATVTPRIGFTVSSWLWYLKSGVAFAGIDHRFVSPSDATSVDISDTKVGWTIGLGGELLLGNNWMLGIEGNRYDFGSVHTTSGVTNFPDHDVHVTMWSILGRVSYKFGSPSYPVAARY
jgi:outer membrane immunogenic protein